MDRLLNGNEPFNGVTSLTVEELNTSRINCETQPISGDGFIEWRVNNIESQCGSSFKQSEARRMITQRVVLLDQ
jgi:hypothetical protein